MSNNENQNPTPNREDVIKSIAKQLTDRRKLRGLSLEKLSETTKIRLIYLKALEDADWEKLPGEVYVKGFLVRYAEHLGLNKNELMAPYLNLIEKRDVASPSEKQTAPPRDFPKAVVAIVGVGVLAVVGLIKLINVEKRIPPTRGEQTVLTQVSTQTSTTEALQSITPVEPVQHVLSVFSIHPLWLSVETENKNFEGFLPQNSTWTWRAEGAFSIRIGHTQDVVMEFDGAPVELGPTQKRVYLTNEG